MAERYNGSMYISAEGDEKDCKEFFEKLFKLYEDKYINDYKIFQKPFLIIEQNKKYEKNLNGIPAWKIKLTEIAEEAAEGKDNITIILEYPTTFQDITEKYFAARTHYVVNGKRKIA